MKDDATALVKVYENPLAIKVLANLVKDSEQMTERIAELAEKEDKPCNQCVDVKQYPISK